MMAGPSIHWSRPEDLIPPSALEQLTVWAFWSSVPSFESLSSLTADSASRIRSTVLASPALVPVCETVSYNSCTIY